jgi:hypothetical protein
MAALGTVGTPAVTDEGDGAASVAFTQVAGADTYIIKVYPKVPHTSTDYDLEDTDGRHTTTRVAGTGATTELIHIPLDLGNPTHSYKVTVIAHDSTAVATDSAASTASDNFVAHTAEERDETFAPVVAETTNPFTGRPFAFAGATYGIATFGRNSDGTVYQSLGGGTNSGSAGGVLNGTGDTRARDAGLVTAAKVLASDLKVKLTDPTQSAGGVYYILQGGAYGQPYLAGGSGLTVDYGVMGEGSGTDFTDRKVEEVGGAAVSESGTGRQLTSDYFHA